jgi:curved DNA-binding protein CbpA
MRYFSSPVAQVIHLAVTVILAILLLASHNDRGNETLNQVNHAEEKYKLRKTKGWGDESYWTKERDAKSLNEAMVETGFADYAILDDNGISLKYNKYAIWFTDSYFPDVRHVQVYSSDGRGVEIILNKDKDFEILTYQNFGDGHQKIGFADYDGDGFTESKYTRGSSMGDKDFTIKSVSWELAD